MLGQSCWKIGICIVLYELIMVVEGLGEIG